MKDRKTVPVFLSCDEKYVPYLSVTLYSLIDNTSENNQYDIHILNTDFSDKTKFTLKQMEKENVTIHFENMNEIIRPLQDRFELRDYYSFSIYFRLFIPSMFPNLDKAIYIDCDTAVLDDIADLYSYDLKDNLVGAVRDRIVEDTKEFQVYVKDYVGVEPTNYFNSGVLLMNLSLFRKLQIEESFVYLLQKYHFKTVAPDQDYLNVLCEGKVLYLPQSWNKMYTKEKNKEPIFLAHFNMFWKPWHYSNVPNDAFFWYYAKKTPYYEALRLEKETYSLKQKRNDKAAGEKMFDTCKELLELDISFASIMNGLEEEELMKKIQKKAPISEYRQKVLDRMAKYELEGGESFFKDVEDDPPSKPLQPDDVDYLSEKFKTKWNHFWAQAISKPMSSIEKKKHKISIDGIENLDGLQNTGAIFTSNHFSPFENVAVKMAAKKIPGKHKFYYVIREGNFFMPGVFGYLLKYCNTLPLSSCSHTIAKFNFAIRKRLKEGSHILVYPEKAMWFNYKKPRPYQVGAFFIAAKNNVPLVPCFITLEGTGKYDSDGTEIQAYTIHILSPIFPDPSKSVHENAEEMRRQNAQQTKAKYEEVYKTPLEYTCQKGG